MAPTPLLFLRGRVYRIKFSSDDPTRPNTIEKYCLCLQQGSIIQNRHFFVGVLLTTCKNNDKPRMYQWKVYVSPTESLTEFGVLIDCSQIYTIPTADVIDSAYGLEVGTMEKVNQALQFGIGVVSVEELKRLRPNE